MPSSATAELVRALRFLRREKRRCERRLEELREALAAAQAPVQPTAEPRRADRSTSGWTEEKRQAVSRRMRDYWAKRRNDATTSRPRAASLLVTARDREAQRGHQGPPP